MANQSIYAAFERMWQHVVNALSGKANNDHSHDDRYYTEGETDSLLEAINTELDGSIKSLSVSGKVITYTKNDGTTGTITTQDTNTDTKVSQTARTAAGEFPILLRGSSAGTTNTTTTTSFSTRVTINPLTGVLTVPTVSGDLEGVALYATNDEQGNSIITTYETKTDASSKLTEAKSYTDTAVATKTQVQFNTWEADD